MNLPLKLVDLVTLLFIGLLVVIIVFLILQRNIKRISRRNDKESHYLSCKSIPKDIKEAIERKHSVSNCYKEPPDLLSPNDLQHQDEKTKKYIIRMKAYEVAKYFEKALMECGYMRQIAVKLEVFIEDLVANCADKCLPKTLLNDFVHYYILAMHDPIPFTIFELRKFILIINRILDHLAASKKEIADRIKQYKLELNSDGDFDFNKFFNDKQSLLANVGLQNLNINNNNNNTSNNESKKKKKKASKKDSKLKCQPCTSAPAMIDSADFVELQQIENGEVSNESESDYGENFNKSNSKRKILKTKKKTSDTANVTNEVTAMSSFAVVGQSKSSRDTSSKRKDSKKNANLINDSDSLENVNLIETRVDHSLVNDSIKNIYDSENEEIPLVGTSSKKSYHKKKSSHSSITILNQKIKNQSTPPPSKPQSQLNAQSSMTTPLIMPIGSTNESQATVGLENEGFNETMI